MAGSQLKRLKASLRDKGLVGPQQSKKQKKRNAQNGGKPDRRAALDAIREEYNPFDLKHAKAPKFPVATNRPDAGNAAKGIQGRPVEAQALGEQLRKDTLLVELQRRQKVGGIVDRRFGENDTTMAPEDKMMERFAREKQRTHKKAGMFDLEDDAAGEGFGLTHMGQALSLDGPTLQDDFDEDMDSGSDAESNDEGRKAYLKRKHLSEAAAPEEAEEGQPERKKSKQEVMKEVIAKSKLHKFERQQAKDDDENLREELDLELPNLHALLLQKGKDVKSASSEKEAAAAVAEKAKLEKAYDLQVKKLAQDRRAQPVERTQTEEEKAEADSARLKELEVRRMKRMRGEVESEDEDDAADEKHGTSDEPFHMPDDEDDFGLGKGIKTRRPTATELGFDDEDDFLIDDDLVASGSDVSAAESDDDEGVGEDEDEGEDRSSSGGESDEDEEFTRGLLNERETNPALAPEIERSMEETQRDDPSGLPYVFPCPQTHEELLLITKKIPTDKLPAVVQRIRALYSPKLASANKAKLANFTRALVQHLPYLSSLPQLPSFSILESLIRHLHSLAKSSFAVDIANELRSHLEVLGRTRPADPNLGDLVIFTAIGTIFPSSDHFHQVVTPTVLLMARYLEKVPQTITDYTRGAYISILGLQFQHLAKRYVPELINFNLNTLCALAPFEPAENIGMFPRHEPPASMRLRKATQSQVRKLSCIDCVKSNCAGDELVATKVATIDTTIKILDAAADLWADKPAFLESFQPVSIILAHLGIKACRAELPEALTKSIEKAKAKMDRMLKLAQLSRRPLELHHHRPLAIKMSVPKFEESFDPTKHYDPDRDRAELAKLKKEHKKERKGAMRELRKDANFLAREKLKAKKAKDAAYEKKYKRLVAEIQGEEGREANSYEREKDQRKRASKRG